jgi:hypothetical protein
VEVAAAAAASPDAAATSPVHPHLAGVVGRPAASQAANPPSTSVASSPRSRSVAAREARRVALGTQHDDVLTVPRHLGYPVRAHRIETPLEDVAIDDESARHLAAALPHLHGPDVDQQSACCLGRGGRPRIEAVQTRARREQQLLDGVHAESDELHAAAIELPLQLRERAQLGRAHRREVARMGNSTAQLPRFQSRKRVRPNVVSAVKSGARSPSRSAMILSLVGGSETNRRGTARTREGQKHESPPTSPGGGPQCVRPPRCQPAADGREPDHHDRQQHDVSERCTRTLGDVARRRQVAGASPSMKASTWSRACSAASSRPFSSCSRQCFRRTERRT